MTKRNRAAAALAQINAAENTLIAALEVERQVETYSSEELKRVTTLVRKAREGLDRALSLEDNTRLKA